MSNEFSPALPPDSPAPAPEPAIARLQRLALEALRAVPAEGPFALLDFPDHANVGDSAIWLGTLAYFRAHRDAGPRYVATAESFSEPALRAAVPEGPIFVHGGGNFGDVWPRHQQFREFLLHRFRDREVVQLPQSIQFDDLRAAERTARAIARHGRFRLYVRDGWSEAFAGKHFDCEVAICPDMAFFLGPLARGAPEVDVLYLLRTDKERATAERPERRPEYRSRVADWLEESALGVRLKRWRGGLRQVGGRRRWDRARMRVGSTESAARARVARGCALLSSGRVVVTDRLHAQILSLLLGIPHAILDNRYGKLARFLDQWLPGAAGIHRAESLREAESWAAAGTGAAGS